MSSQFVKVGKKYTIVIPRGIRESLGLKEGQLSEIRVEEGKIVIIPKTADPFKRLTELMGDLTYDEETERKAERWLLKRVKSNNSSFR